MDKVLINIASVQLSAQVIRAVKHKVRIKLLTLLEKHKELSVTVIYTKLKISQVAVSGHLSVLREVGLVSSRRVGKMRYYSLVVTRVAEINEYARLLANLVV